MDTQVYDYNKVDGNMPLPDFNAKITGRNPPDQQILNNKYDTMNEREDANSESGKFNSKGDYREPKMHPSSKDY